MQDVKPFQHIMRLVVKHHGSIKRAIKATGISTYTYSRLVNENEVSYAVGKKIMDEYKIITEAANENI